MILKMERTQCWDPKTFPAQRLRVQAYQYWNPNFDELLIDKLKQKVGTYKVHEILRVQKILILRNEWRREGNSLCWVPPRIFITKLKIQQAKPYRPQLAKGCTRKACKHWRQRSEEERRQNLRKGGGKVEDQGKQ